MKKNIVPIEYIEQKIFLIRGQKVMLDEDLAELYGVPTKVLLQSVKRNRERFPRDFLFSLKIQEVERLRSQIVTSKKDAVGRGGRRYRPYAFTEQGVAMLSSVLRSKRAVEVNIEIMRAFVRLRSLVAQSKELSHKLADLESHIGTHDKAICSLFDAIRQLMTPPKKGKKPVGFVSIE